MERQRRDFFFLSQIGNERSVTTDSADGNDVTLGVCAVDVGRKSKKKKKNADVK